jgi:hypothetical protein
VDRALRRAIAVNAASPPLFVIERRSARSTCAVARASRWRMSIPILSLEINSIVFEKKSGSQATARVCFNEK